MKDIIWRNAKIATMNLAANHARGEHKDEFNEYGLIIDHDLIVRGDKILAIVKTGTYATENECQIIDVKGQLITPGLIDSHTHLVFGGNRAAEWEERLKGVPYVEIAKRGGGINSTVQATRTSSAVDLFDMAAKRLKALALEGVTTLESKSGYGLDLENETKQLQIIQKLGQVYPVEMVATLLSAHTVPPEFSGNGDAYIDLICTHILPTLWNKNLFEAVDVFCENVGFSLAQTQKVFAAAHKLGIPVKGHTEQLSNLGGSALVAKFKGLSVDHIEYLDEAGVLALKEAGTVATILPSAYYFLKETQKPPIDLLRKHGVPIAIATDFNPGTSPLASLRLAMNMACVQFGLTPAEALAGVTINAAQALGRSNSHGQLREGFYADFVVWDVERPVEIVYELGYNPMTTRVFRGEITDFNKWSKQA